MKKTLLVFLLIYVISLFAPGVSLAAEKKQIYKFWSKYCPHCKDENAFLDKLQKQRSDIEILSYEVTSDKGAADLFKRFSDHCGNTDYSVPALYIGTKHIIGFKDEITTGKLIEQTLDSYTLENYPDPLKHLDDKNLSQTSDGQGLSQCESAGATDSGRAKLPFLGEVELKSVSLPLLTLVLGTVDGFNPCALWALIALLTLLISMGSRKRVFLVGGIFLISSWLIYYVFLMAWVSVFHFIKIDLAVRIIVGVLGILAGWQLIKSYQKETQECKVSSGKRQVTKMINYLANAKFIPILIFGAVALAFAVNLIEFMCSVNLPVVFTKVLALNNLPKWQYMSYLAAYNTLYMLDDIVVFILALISLRAFTGFGAKYSRYTKLIGAIVIIIVALLLIFAPQALTI
ncbi:MAG: hypothetical protein OEV37_00585 [Candidatus Berkelbacteria bacterium]|nr:hypothetical protein [Candidatus Berkelbacteria bacterium]